MSIWAENAVFYHIYPLGFCGAEECNDFASLPESRILKVLQWIPHLKSLGINAVYFGPVFQSTKHGYDTADYRVIDRRLGTNEDFKRVCDALRAEGVRTVLDGVFNHVGRDFPAFRDVQEKKWDSPYKDWFHINFDGNSAYNDGFYYEGWEGYYELVKLNLRSPQVKEYLLGAVSGWFEEFGIDGLRLDVAYCLDPDFLKELRRHCKARDPEFWLMGETLHGDYNTWMNNEMLDSVTNYECYKGIYSSLNSKNMFEIAYSYNRQFGGDGWALYKGRHLYAFVENHDVSRIASAVTDERSIPLSYALLFFMPGISSVYYGGEWGFKGAKSDGDGALRPSLELQADTPLTETLRALIRLRKSCRALSHGNYRQLYLTNEQFAFAREMDGEFAVLALNIAEQTVTIPLVEPFCRGYTPDGNEIDVAQGLSLEPYSFRVITSRKTEIGPGVQAPKEQMARIAPEIKEDVTEPVKSAEPQIHENATVFPGAVIVGDVTLAEHSSVWYNAVLRGDIAPITVGKGSNIQDGCVLHVDFDIPLRIGERVTVGHGAVLHSCDIGDGSLIGMGAIVLNGAVIGKNCVIGAGALVTQNTKIPDGSMAIGSPAKVKRTLTESEMDASIKNAGEYIRLSQEYRDAGRGKFTE